jgi:hypothetical protein
MQDKEKTERRQRAIIIGCLLVGALIFGVWMWAVGCNWRNELESLFSGWAFAGLVCTVLLQREELKLQREELEDTKKVLARAADAQEKSEKALASQIQSMNLGSLVDGYAAMLDYYDRHNRNSGGPEGDQSKHARARLKQLMNHLEGLHGGSVPDRPSDWDRL